MPPDSAALDVDDVAATSALIESIRAERERIRRNRFQGKDPRLAGPAGKTAAVTLARMFAADREGALVRAGGETFNPGEDRAEEALQTAIDALSVWNFDAFVRELSTTARLARDPARQQRASALRALGATLRALVLTVPGDRLGSERAALTRLLPTLDHLDESERTHYAAESARLMGTWREAAADTALWRRWALLRAQLALRTGADESALAWTLRAWDREQPAPFHVEPALAAVITATRSVFARLANPSEEHAEDLEPPRPRDVVLAVNAAITAHDAGDDGRDPFAFVPFHPPVDSQASAGERPA
jgi:hypothetical protein